MKCPVDGTELKITDRQGIEIDYCPQCRGIWLDRGELDKILQRSSAYEQDTLLNNQPPTRERQPEPRYNADHDDDRYDHDSRYPPGKRKKSFLGEMLDIFD